jgi:hypothetical protein
VKTIKTEINEIENKNIVERINKDYILARQGGSSLLSQLFGR